MAREIDKTGVGVTLPQFLQKTEKYPAFISNNKGKILTCNNFLKNICSISDNKTVYVKNIFTTQGLAAFNEATKLVLSKPAVLIETAMGHHQISWELSCLPEGEGNILCLGAITFTQPTSSIPLDENHFSAFMNNSPALMWATDLQGRLVIINKKYKEVTGFSDSDVGKTLWELFPADLAEIYSKNDGLVVEKNGLMEIEEISVDRFNQKRDYLVYKFPLQTPDYGLVVAGWSVDITEHKNANKKLVHQNNRFRQIARLQSHAVRRPLANILGLIDLIQYYTEEDDFSEVSTMVKLLKDSSNDLDAIIKKIVNKAGVFHPMLQTSV